MLVLTAACPQERVVPKFTSREDILERQSPRGRPPGSIPAKETAKPLTRLSGRGADGRAAPRGQTRLPEAASPRDGLAPRAGPGSWALGSSGQRAHGKGRRHRAGAQGRALLAAGPPGPRRVREARGRAPKVPATAKRAHHGPPEATPGHPGRSRSLQTGPHWDGSLQAGGEKRPGLRLHGGSSGAAWREGDPGRLARGPGRLAGTPEVPASQCPWGSGEEEGVPPSSSGFWGPGEPTVGWGGREWEWDPEDGPLPGQVRPGCHAEPTAATARPRERGTSPSART